MKRKWMATVWISVLGMSLLLAGCPKKEPMAPPPPTPEPTQVAPPVEVPEPPAPPPVAEEPNPLDGALEEADKYAHEMGLLGDVFFDFDKYNLSTEARSRLAKNADFMKSNPQFTYTLEGHCDERGTNEYNIALGDRRANTSLDYLVSLGSNGGAMQSISYGEEKPQCATSEEACWWQNRRTHFRITGRSGG